MPFGRGRDGPSASRKERAGLESSTIIGEPWLTKRAGGVVDMRDEMARLCPWR
jgi:hypothetical protein